MSRIKLFATLPVLLVLSITGKTQQTISTVSLQVGIPQEEFQQTYDATGVGLRFNVLRQINKSPISLGGELGLLINGSDSRRFDIYYLGFYDRYRISATNNIVSLGLKMRADLTPPKSIMQIFIEGSVGTNLFFSSVDVKRETFFGDTEYAGGNSTKGHWAFTWGPGAGIEIPLNRSRDIALSVKGSYLFGSNTKYLTDPYINNDGEVFFTQRESETTMLLMELGVRFQW
jgi:hypothetical protein